MTLPHKGNRLHPIQIRGTFRIVVVVLLALAPLYSWSQLTPGSMDVHWNEGATNCSAHSEPPLQVHSYNAQTYLLRESLCSTFEAPFMYLLVGSTKALLIDSGDIADPKQAPLAATVLQLLPEAGSSKLPLLVVHTHRHLDHRAGDAQFANLSNVTVVGYDLSSVQKFYGFSDWPNGVSQIDLGNRSVDVIPTPGHNATEVTFYDRNTGLMFSGDLLLPARLLVDDTKAYIASADRLAAFVRDRPVSFVLGGHIEKDATSQTFPWQSQYHPNERVLQMSKADVLALPVAMRRFNGFYTNEGSFLMMNSIHILLAFGTIAALVLIALVWAFVRFVRARRRARRRSHPDNLAA